jgi:hypothetical protein
MDKADSFKHAKLVHVKNPMGRRLHFIDVARSYAISLVFFAHAVVTFGGWCVMGDLSVPLLLITRTGTPLFLLIFGLMLELVYVTRADTKHIAHVARRLLTRSAQCYLGYALTAFSGIFGGYLSLDQAVRALIFLDNAHYGNILRIFSIALFLAVPLIWLSRRYGVWVLILLLLCVWSCDILLKQHMGMHFGILNPWVGILFGTGTFRIGPSIWHSMTFVLVGILLGKSLRGWYEYGLGQFYIACIFVVLLAMVVITYLVFDIGIANFIDYYTTYGAYRAHNHIGYYAAGILVGALTLLLLSRIVPLYEGLPNWADLLLVCGRSTLFSFTLGNILLNFIPIGLKVHSVASLLMLALLFVVVVFLLVNLRQSVQPILQRMITIMFRKSRAALMG